MEIELTGKCLAAFEIYRDKQHKEWIHENKKENEYYGYSVFRELPFEMQWGVLVDFFDSEFIEIEVVVNPKHVYPHLINITVSGEKRFCRGLPNKFETRNEARKAAIKKANEIYNSNNQL